MPRRRRFFTYGSVRRSWGSHLQPPSIHPRCADGLDKFQLIIEHRRYTHHEQQREVGVVLVLMELSDERGACGNLLRRVLHEPASD